MTTGILNKLTIEQVDAARMISGYPITVDQLHEPWLRVVLVQNSKRDYAGMISGGVDK